MVLEKVRTLIANSLGMEEGEITPESTFESLRLDSLDLVQIIMDLEGEFEIIFPDDPAPTTVADLVAYIEENAV